MRTFEQIKASLQACRPVLEKEYGVVRLAVFGSYARSDQTESSDVDILVELKKPLGLRFVHLADYLESILGLKVDLLTPDAVKPNRRAYVMKDLVYV